jgi:hypothetical protein
MSACKGLLGRLFGHKFGPRYSEGAAPLQSLTGCSASEAAAFVRAAKPLTYHNDVCERCGEVVNRKGGAS